MSSQRHRQVVRNYGAACTAIAEKQPAAGYLRQQPGPYTVPVGPAGGPLQGSSLAGPPPAAIPNPQFDGDLLKLALILSGGGPSEPPPETATTTVTGLEPNTAVLGDPDFTLSVIGTGFNEYSIIVFADQQEPTTFVSSTEVTTGVKPSLGWGPNTPIPVYVRTGAHVSNTVDFTFTEA